MKKPEASRPKLKWRFKLHKVYLLISVFLILTMPILFLSFPIPSTSSFISLVHAQESSLEVYLDPDGTSLLRDIYWGVLYPSQSVMKTMYVKNLGTTEESLSLATDNWSPPKTQTYLSLTWDYDGSKLDTNEIRKTTLILSVSPDIEDITDFSFDIHIATEFTEPTPAPTPTPFGVDEYIEGEDAHYINEFMVVVVDSEASGGKYVWGPEGSDPDDEGLLRYSVEIEDAETYRVWLRTYWTSGGGNSFSVNFDVIPVDSDLVGNDATYGVWHWVSKDFELADGIQDLIIRDREDGSKLDRIFITNDLTVTPF